ncbi:hypothetical protein OCT63_20465 [Vibrio sp. RW]|uniref:hypothetical protein n=1 Tax=Vibrio sp. RW TaxID=2998833 RepID=UPI0022CD764C|nr:hypothetical protein [Vibrio sp. RW]MDA0146599.1 hypothetical protein [Vibrio sp. RW]
MRNLRNIYTSSVIKRLQGTRVFDLVKTVNGQFFDGVISNVSIGENLSVEGNLWDCNCNNLVSTRTDKHGLRITTTQIVNVGFIDEIQIHFIETVNGERYVLSNIYGEYPFSYAESVLCEVLKGIAERIKRSDHQLRKFQWSDPLADNLFSLASTGEDVVVHQGQDSKLYAAPLGQNVPLRLVLYSDLKYPSPVPF